MAEIAGLKLIVPTSVAGSGVSVSASGKITLTSASTVTVNGCYTSTYDNYLVIYRGTCATGSANLVMRLRVSGSDASGTNYTRQYLDVGGTSISGGRQTSRTSAHFGFITTSQSGSHLYVYGPALAQPTAFRDVTAGATSGAYISDYASTHSLSTAYDGFSAFTEEGYALTGSICIYGLSQ